MATPVVEAFSLSHAQVMDGVESFVAAAGTYAQGGDAWDIYGVNEASLDPDMDDYDNEGDDVIESTWSWLNFADVKVQAGYLSFPLISTLTGQAITSSGAGNSQMFQIDLWHEDSMNVAPKPMLIAMPSKTSDGAVRRLLIGLYKVQFKPMTFDGPAYKDGLKVNYEGKALMASVDETGTPFVDGKKRVGRLISIL